MSRQVIRFPRRSHTLAVAAVALAAAAALAGPIAWKTGAAELAAQTPAEIEATLHALLAERTADVQRVVVQFDRPIADTLRGELAAGGLRLLSYVGDNAYFATLVADSLDPSAVSQTPSLTAVGRIRPEWKLDPVLAAGLMPPWAQVDTDADGTPIVGVYVLFHRDVDLEGDGIDLVEAYGSKVRSVLESVNGLVIELRQDVIPFLADLDPVQWIEPPMPKMEPVNAENRARTGADIVQAPPYNLDGSGVTVLIYDGGTARSTHVDFQGRLTVHDASGMHYHSTHVAGTVGGAGVANPTYKGMAPAVTLLSYGFEMEGGLQPGFLYTDPGDIEDDYSEAISAYGADISNNSIGTNTASNGYPCDWEGNYGVTGALIDTIVRGDGSNPLFNEPFMIVWANGNERGSGRCGTTYHTTAPPACAKNHITVGALYAEDDTMSSFSSWGPTDDDRMKPDVCAPGVDVTSCDSSSDTAYTTLSGTSMASPTTCGCSALLLQDYRAYYPGEPDFRNSTLKAILAHTATDLGNTGPDYQFGYGSIRIQPAVDLMRAGNFLEAEVSQDGVFSVLVSVNPGDTELKVTLAWDDAPGTPNVNPVLVNDLDLRLYSPTSVRHYPWTLGGLANPSAPAVQTREDHLNNIEQVFVANPESGAWRVEIHGTNVPEGPQPFSIAASPQLVACSSHGIIALGAALYSCDAVAEIQVVDCDLNTDDGVIETVTVSIASDSEPAGESVLLTETAAETADFRGTIAFDVVNSPGVLQVADGDTVVATYIDADDGEGGYDVEVTASGAIDCLGPAIFNVQVTDIGSQTATITFDTDESALGSVRYGLACDSLPYSAAEAHSGTSHTVNLTGLDFNTHYYFVVDAVDGQGNESSDDNGGQCYSFSTPNVVYNFPMNADPGWTTAGQWAFGTPTGGGSYNGDPTSGYTGTNVYGYNLNGDYSNNLPATYLTTPAIDCTGLTDVNLSFRRWLGVESNSNYDEATIEVSNNGTNWTVIWRATDLGVAVSDNEWTLQEFNISSLADNQSTVYVRWGMGPTDTNLTYPGWNIDDVQIIASGGLLAIGFPDGLPEIMAPGEPLDITVRIVEGDEQYLEGSGTLHYRYDGLGGQFETAALVPLSGDYYQATLPPANCDDTPEFYFSAEGTVSGVIYQPPTAPAATYSVDVGEFVVSFEDDFESDQGWTVENSPGLVDGPWDRGIPVNCARGDPPSDYDGSSRCYLTDNSALDACNSDVDGGYTWLLSPTIDLSAGDAEVSYALWYTNNYGADPNNDLFVVWVSNDNGGTWTEVETFGPGTSAGWAQHTFMVGDYVTPTSQVKVRFEASDLNSGSVVEAGIDAFVVSSFVCEGFIDCNDNGVPDDEDIASGTSTDYNGNGIPDECDGLGDMNCDDVVNAYDIDCFVCAVSPECDYDTECPGCDRNRADCNGDGDINAYDIDLFIALVGGL